MRITRQGSFGYLFSQFPFFAQNDLPLVSRIVIGQALRQRLKRIDFHIIIILDYSGVIPQSFKTGGESQLGALLWNNDVSQPATTVEPEPTPTPEPTPEPVPQVAPDPTPQTCEDCDGQSEILVKA